MNIQGLMKQAQEMQKKMESMQAELALREIEGEAGGGAVKVLISGKGDLKRVNIDPSLMTPDDAEVVGDMVVAAWEKAKAKADASFSEEMTKMTGGLALPPGLKLPF